MDTDVLHFRPITSKILDRMKAITNGLIDCGWKFNDTPKTGVTLLLANMVAT